MNSVWYCPIIGCEEENIVSDGDVGATCCACGQCVSFYVHPEDMPRRVVLDMVKE